MKHSISPPQPFEKYIETLSRATFFGLLSEKKFYPQSVNEANTIGMPAVIADPWGRNFASGSRTLTVDLKESDKAVAGRVKAFLEACASQPRASVPSWNETFEAYVEHLYAG